MGSEWVGFLGVVVGASLQFLFDHLRYDRENKGKIELDKKRKELLQQALANRPKGFEWRELSTLCGIIGAEPQTTTRLLIELGARGSEGKNDVWALLSEKPLDHSRV